MLNEGRHEALVPLVQERVERLSDLAPLTDYMLGARKALTGDDFAHKSLTGDDVIKVLYFASLGLDALDGWRREDLLACCQDLAERCELKFRDFLFPLFIALSGRAVALPLFDSMVFLGPDLSRARIRDALDVLGVSGKMKKRLDKAFVDSRRSPT
jgi:glutamyl-tRNA synthetase